MSEHATGEPRDEMLEQPALRTRRVLVWADNTWVVFAFILALTLARVAYLYYLSPYTLVEDEAHYWDWSRNLDWSYYSKGPGVAWMIALSTSLFGDTEFGVRLPAIIFSAIGTMAVAALARSIFRDRRVMLLSAVAFQTMPGVQVTSFLMTIDGPYLACWALACWCAWRALTKGSQFAWVGFGLAIAMGFLFKYTILLLLPGLIVFAIVKRRHLRVAGLPWVLAGGAFAYLGLIPVVIWNAQHDWATVRHLLGHLGVSGGDMPARTSVEKGWDYNPMWTLEFFVLNLGIAGAIMPLSILGAINMIRAKRQGPAGWLEAGPTFLFCASAPILLFYLGVTLFTNTEANWAIAGFVTLSCVCGWAALDGIHRVDHPVRFTWNAGLGTLVVMLVTLPILGALAAKDSRPLGIPLHRVMGARVLARSAEEQLQKLAEQAEIGDGAGFGADGDPFVMAVHYGRASLLAFYMEGHPVVYSASSHFGDGRRSEFDIWEHTDLSRQSVNDRLRGRAGLLFGGEQQAWERVFGSVRDIGPLDGESKADRTTFVGTDFLGFDRLSTSQSGGE